MNDVFKYRTSCHEITGDQRCEYCGSLSVDSAIKLLRIPTTHFSGADWKYGWPHKFYIGDRKFYNNHLNRISDELLKEYSILSEKCFGIEWTRDEKGVKYRTVGKFGYSTFYGYQQAGTIDSLGEPIITFPEEKV